MLRGVLVWWGAVWCGLVWCDVTRVGVVPGLVLGVVLVWCGLAWFVRLGFVLVFGSVLAVSVLRVVFFFRFSWVLVCWFCWFDWFGFEWSVGTSVGWLVWLGFFLVLG